MLKRYIEAMENDAISEYFCRTFLGGNIMKTTQTRRPLLAAVVALAVCAVMLVGTTLAWFTQTIESGNNVVVSGNVKVAVEYFDGSQWKSIEGATDLFDASAKWEPGYADVAYLRVRNIGELRFRSYMTVNVNQETAGVNALGHAFKLSDYLEFATVRDVNGETNPYTDRKQAYDATEDKTMNLGHASEYVSIMPGESVYFALSVVMPEKVGNVANHNGEEIPQIALGVLLNATQDTQETDAFGNDFDKAASWLGAADVTRVSPVRDAANGMDIYYVTRPSDLAWIAQFVNSGEAADAYAANEMKVVVGTYDVASGVVTPVRYFDMNDQAWDTIGTAEHPFIWAFDGNGVQIANLYVEGATVPSLFGYTDGATIVGLN